MAGWKLEYEGYDPAQEGLREALCAVGNGYFVTRGALPFASADGVHYPGTYATGLYDRLTTTILGQDVTNEDLVNLPNWLPLTFKFVDDEQADTEAPRSHDDSQPVLAWNDGWFDLADVDILDYHQTLDLRSGVLTRRLRLGDRLHRRCLLAYRQLVSMAHRHVAAVEMTLLPENFSGHVVVRSALDGRVTNSGVSRYQALRGDHLVPVDAARVDDETVLLVARTRQSHVRIAQAARTRLYVDERFCDAVRTSHAHSGLVATDHQVELGQGRQLRVEKVVTLFTSRDPAISESAEQACRRLDTAGDIATLLDDHVLAWRRIWKTHDLRLTGRDGDDDERTQMVLNLHIFHLLQTVSENSIDLDAGVPARGLHGEAYRGHIFWDELFVFPYLNLRLPELTRALLRYRYRRLPEARRLAHDEGHAGAAFPWQSASDGREATQTLHLNPRSGRWTPDHSRLQRHVNFAVAYNVWQYVQITDDSEFLATYGAEIILEIARFLASITSYNHALDRYEIRGVMGPDEYHDGYPWRAAPGLDNNAYTNVMTVWTLLRAIEALDVLPDRRRQELATRLRLGEAEVVEWEAITRRMRVCFLDDGIVSQFEGYDRLEELDWQRYRETYTDISRLDRILEAEGDTPNRYKASKQADVLMLFYLLTAEELADLLTRLGYDADHGLIPRTVEYYLQRTSDGSTLSKMVHSWVLARRDRKRSYALFRRALDSDVADTQGGTTPEGIHLGAMAGTVDMVQRGYTGLQPRGDVLWVNPALPDGFARLQFTVRYRRSWDVLFDIDHERIKISTPPGSTIKIGYGEDVTEVPSGSTVELAL